MTAAEFVARFVAGLREKAGDLRGYGAVEAAQGCERVAADLEAEFRRWAMEELTVPEAARESGYSEDRLREMLREGKLAGRRDGEHGPYRVERRNLPHRPTPQGDDDLDLIERTLLHRASADTAA